MGYVQAKPTIENKTVKCPFCKEGDIDILYTSEHMSVHTTHAAGKSAKIPNYHPEKYEVYNDCPNCKKKKGEIKEVLKNGGTPPVSHEERLKRIKAAGLPTMIVNERR